VWLPAASRVRIDRHDQAIEPKALLLEGRSQLVLIRLDPLHGQARLGAEHSGDESCLDAQRHRQVSQVFGLQLEASLTDALPPLQVNRSHDLLR